MPTPLPPTPADDPVSSFAACHDRIRTFCAGLARMAELPSLVDPRVPEAAARAHRYFAEGLPLHAADEDDSLAPRLLRLAPTSQPLLEELAHDHAAIDACLATLLPLLARLAAGQGVPEAPFRAAVAPLLALLLPHIAREEAELFPLCAALTEEDRRAIAEEVRGRRR